MAIFSETGSVHYVYPLDFFILVDTTVHGDGEAQILNVNPFKGSRISEVSWSWKNWVKGMYL